jgi:hypothetical protein
MVRRALVTILAVSGGLLAWRTLAGPVDAPVRIHSPLNLESCFALSGLLLLLTGADWSRETTGTPPRRLERTDALSLAAVALVALAAFSCTAGFYFLSDDFLILQHASTARGDPWSLFARPGGDGFFRPAGYTVLGLNSAWAGASPVRWHWTGFGLHAMNSALVAALGAALGLSRLAALFSGLLFALHATRPEAALWVAGRFDLLATFFGLISLLFFTQSFGRRPIAYRGASLAAMILAILSKESAYALPLIITVIAWHRRALPAAAPHIAVAGALFAWRWALFGGIGGYPGAASPGALAVANVLFLRLWAVLFFPVNWTTEPGPLLSTAMVVYLCVLVTLFWRAAGVEMKRLAVPLAFSVLAALPPVQQLLIGADLQKSRLLYLSSAGFGLLLAVWRQYVPPKWRYTSAAAILLFQAVALRHNLQAWEYASGKARLACATAAQCDRPAVTGLPRSLRGVYFFANGFEQCVALQGQPARGECRLEWDAATDSIRLLDVNSSGAATPQSHYPGRPPLVRFR